MPVPGEVLLLADEHELAVEDERQEERVDHREVVAREDRGALLGHVLGAAHPRPVDQVQQRTRRRPASSTSRTTVHLSTRPTDCPPTRARARPTSLRQPGRARATPTARSDSRVLSWHLAPTTPTTASSRRARTSRRPADGAGRRPPDHAAPPRADGRRALGGDRRRARRPRRVRRPRTAAGPDGAADRREPRARRPRRSPSPRGWPTAASSVRPQEPTRARADRPRLGRHLADRRRRGGRRRRGALRAARPRARPRRRPAAHDGVVRRRGHADLPAGGRSWRGATRRPRSSRPPAVVFVLGVGVLVWRMPHRRDPDDDDTGAVV